MRITGHYRQMDIAGDCTKPGGISNPTGGVTSKLYHLVEALPSIEIYSDMWNPGDIVLVEALWFDELGEDVMLQRIERYRQAKGFKILWTSDTCPLRWKGEYREAIFDASDVVGTLSDYSQQLLRAFTPKVEKLYDPLDIDMFVPGKKNRSVFGIGQISIEKNVEMIAKIFAKLPTSTRLKKWYFGSRTLWGLDHHDETSIDLELMLMDACDYLESNMPRTDIATLMSTMWGYVADTRYDFSSYSMMEAMLCGCWLFTGKHLMYDERPSFRFNTVLEAVSHIKNQLKECPPESGVVNEEARQFIIDRNSYDVFRKQLMALVGRISFGF